MPPRPLDPRTDPTIAPDSVAGTLDAGSQPEPRPSGPVSGAPVGLRSGDGHRRHLRDHAAARPGRHGRGVRGQAPAAARQAGRGQGAAVGATGRESCSRASGARRRSPRGSATRTSSRSRLQHAARRHAVPRARAAAGRVAGARLQRGPLPLERGRCRSCAQVGSALAAAHREGIVHRDLKPRQHLPRARPSSAARCATSSRCSTSASRRSAARRRCRPRTRRCSARRSTWRPSRRPGATTRSTRAPTCSRSARCVRDAGGRGRRSRATRWRR